MKRSAIRELTFRLIYSLEIQKAEDLEEQIELYLECNEVEDDEAKEYIKDAVGRCDEENPKTKLLFYTLMQDFYENRVLTVKESDKPRLAHTTNSIVLQLQAQLLQEENNG